MKSFASFLLLLAARLLADEQDDRFAALPKGTPAVAERSTEAWSTIGEDTKKSVVDAKDRSFKKAIRVQIGKRPAQTYAIQLRAKTVAPIKEGDFLLAVFEARALEPLPRTGAGKAAFVFELNKEPHTKSVDYVFDIPTEWRKFYVPFQAKMNHSPEDTQAMFRIGFDAQTIEFGDLQVIHYGTAVTREQLPYTPVSYAGREETANWRLLAAERIDKIRKAFLTVRVFDANGKPVPKAAVSVRMKRHSFGWGSAVDAKTLFGEGPEHDRYRAHILENFNRVVLENDLKWHSWSQDPQLGMRAITWLRERGLAVRGHCLVWPGKENLPPWIHPLLGHPEALREALLARVRETAGVLRGQLVEWDVINEPFSNFDVQTALSGVALAKGGDAVEQHAETLAQFFHAARKVDPEVKLDINDYSILETGGTDAAHQDHYERTIRRLLEKQTPLGGIGIQGHFNEQLTPVPRLWEILDRFAKFGLPIQITELDVNTYDEALQADYTRDFLTAMFAHESVSGVLTWGFWEKRHWIPNAAFYRADWSPRPAAQVWQDLVRKKWWTSADLTTDAKGEADIRGFLGDYDVTVEHEGKKADGTVILLRSGATVELVLKN